MTSNGYPKVPIKAWRTLRSRAASAPSTRFTPAAVAALMGMSSPISAANNTVLPMRRLGLIDDDGALTPRGNKWRIDASYADACQEILDEIYPGDLAALRNDAGQPDQQQIRTWFDHNGFGDSNARQMAATYMMIASKEAPEAGKPEQKTPTAKRSAPNTVASRAKTASTVDKVPTPPRTPELTTSANGGGPNVHLDIQIHIPADASVEQIDHIFASMARHLYKQ